MTMMLPLVGGLQKVQAPEQGGLAGAGGADDGQGLALLQFKADVLQDLGIAKVLFNVLDFQNRHIVPLLSAEIAQLLLHPAKQQGQRPVEDQVVDPVKNRGHTRPE